MYATYTMFIRLILFRMNDSLPAYTAITKDEINETTPTVILHHKTQAGSIESVLTNMISCLLPLPICHTWPVPIQPVPDIYLVNIKRMLQQLYSDQLLLYADGDIIKCIVCDNKKYILYLHNYRWQMNILLYSDIST